MKAEDILAATKVVLLVDWPSREVPDTLVRAGYEVVVHGGPAPDDYSTYVVDDGEVVVQRTGSRRSGRTSCTPIVRWTSCPRSSSRRNGSAPKPSGFSYPPRSRSVPWTSSGRPASPSSPYLPDAVRALNLP